MDIFDQKRISHTMGRENMSRINYLVTFFFLSMNIFLDKTPFSF